MFILTKTLFANNEILSAVSTEFERKEYLAKMNYYPNTWRGASRGAGPPEVRSPMHPHGCIGLRPSLLPKQVLCQSYFMF